MSSGIDMENLIRKLEVVSVFKQLPESFSSDNEITIDESEIASLLGYSSILSLSDEPEEISLSYELVTRLLEYTYGECEKVVAASEVVFSRIGNFPGRSLLRDRHSSSLSATVSPAIRLECLAREAENTFFLDEQRSALLTDFQYKFLTSLSEETSLSVSAPTSAGKSFILNLDLIRSIKESRQQSIVYVVPTRALISEVSHRIRAALREDGLSDVVVRTAPFPLARDKIEKAAVYVFTQERLMSFMNSADVEPFISSLIVDEAHEIQNGKRGIILQNSIDIALSRFDNVKVLFASPLIKNPAYILSLFDRTSEGRYFVEQVSPVSQNLIFISDVAMKPKEADISLLSRGELIPISRITSEFRFRDSRSLQRANIALAISAGKESVISFSNGPSEAENVASHIADLNKGYEPSEEALLFADFVKNEIHPDYPLVNCILNGVAFHYGNMPSLVRSGVESLFKNGDIKIICCTSTLLQGVNLPAKHIVIENPMSGDTPMNRADFLNLSGRAGRLLQEFHGNIWCIRPSEWRSDCYEGARLQEITSAISVVMEDGGLSIQGLLNGNAEDSEKVDEAEAAFGKLYHDYLMYPDDDIAGIYRTEENSDELDKTLEAIKEIKVTLPIHILENNQSLRPDQLQRLYETLNCADTISDVAPMSPYAVGAKGRIDEILTVLGDCFGWEMGYRYKSWISFLAYKWVWGESIGRILAERITYLRRDDPDVNVSSAIRGCLQVIEEAVRFKMVKYFSAYIDILRHVALERGLSNELEAIEPYHIYLEFGSCSRNALNLMALGLSRFTALYMEGKFDFDSEVEAEEYLKKMTSMNLSAINMPDLCRREIIDLLS
ncbi:DEAD/DEAH box helicase [Neptunomonas phycophila]|uniref:DEAD/DEAH box helicase n=1 Tax=Neptunomonas phycophila TaxID=1572645 RepID=A0AAW7XHM7_9GAMM|nr:DEAD/DEAH box helicase [Neptunomonas phycophila]MDO6452483.1 DEAD/DEAH box helicase [Neptunomonas phycophila]